jgi:outer membrane receptor protein involved in Fe transport
LENVSPSSPDRFDDSWGIAMKRQLALVLGASVLALAAGTGPADAQTATPAASSATQVGELVVTADKRQELVKDVAQSVTAVSGQTLDLAQAFDFEDYAKLVPGLSLNEARPGQTQIILRGLNTGGVGSTAATYLDETPYGSSNALANGSTITPDLDTFDMQRIEVLRGPQGTLYGAGTLGGIVKFVSNPPDPHAYAAELEVGGEGVDGASGYSGGWSIFGMGNVPLGDRFALRLDGDYRDIPGYIDDPSLGEKDANRGYEGGLRASLLADLAPNFTVRLTALGENIHYDDLNEEDLQINPATGVPLQPLTPLIGDLQTAQGVPQPVTVDYRIYNATMNWNLGFANLTSATSYGTYKTTDITDVTVYQDIFGPGFAIYEPSLLTEDRFTQELRLASPADQKFEWLVGGYYDHESTHLFENLETVGGPAQGNLTLDSIYKEEAAFATVTYHFTPTIDLAVGGRYAHNSQSEVQTDVAAGAGFLVPNEQETGKSSDDSFTFSVAPRWRPTSDVTVYARIASGYQPGGPNAMPVGPPVAGVPLTYKPATVYDYEAGIKTDLFDHHLSLDVSGYYIDWVDIQLLTIVDMTGVDGNGGSARSDGFEGTAAWVPFTGFTLTANGAYTDAILTSNTSPIVGGKSGDSLPFSPKWSSSLDAAYTWPISSTIDGFIGGTWAYIGQRESLFSATIGQVALAAYNTFDLRAGVNVQKWRLEVWAKNIGDARGVTNLGENGSVNGGTPIPFVGVFGESINLIQPRTVGVTATARF